MRIVLDDLCGTQIVQLLEEHLAHMYAITPPESVHALDVDSLKSSDVTFWSAWENDTLLGCGALQSLGNRHGEIKSMRTASAQNRKGVATSLLNHIISEARVRGYRALFLETGSMAEFALARALYKKRGFAVCEPFADYVEDCNSAFYRLELEEA